MADALTELAEFIRLGRTDADGKAKELLGALFGGRYHKNCAKDALIRDALGLAGPQDDDRGDAGSASGSGRSDNVPFAGLTAPVNTGRGR